MAELFKHTLSEATPECYQNARLASDWIPALKQQRLFKLFIPKALGGLELCLMDAASFLMESAEINGSLGWLHNLASGANFFCGYFDEDTAAELFSSPEVLLSGSGAPAGRIYTGDPFLTATGRWNFCTAAGYATHFTATALDEQDKPVTFITEAGGVEIREHWRAFGLRASSTRQIAMEGNAIPPRYLFEIGRQKSFFSYPIYQMDFESFARICLSATWQGIMHGLLDALRRELPQANENIRRQLNSLWEKAGYLQQTRAAFIETLQENNYTIARPERLRSNIKAALGKQHQEMYLEISKLSWNLGLHITDEANRSHWILRDLQTASQHFFIK